MYIFRIGSNKKFLLGDKEFLPEELSSFIIRRLKEDAEEFLGEEVKEAIISVPAYFNDAQRRATKRAGEMAGLKVERMINEPTAAGIAYGIHKKKLNTKFLVFDLGGGTFDVSMLQVFNNIIEVRGVAGDNFLGGDDFTNVIFEMFLREKNLKDAELDKKTVAHIKRKAEECKLAFETENNVVMKCKINDEIIEYEMSYADYEKSCQMLLMKIRKPIERVLKDVKIKIKDIDEIILIGGGTKLRVVRSFVAKLFGRLPNVNINPDQTVALGAAIQGAMKERKALIKDIVLTDVCPYTLGTDVSVNYGEKGYESGHFCPIIERNTTIPVSKTERLYTVYDNQRKLKVEILQGESRFSRNNILLGELTVDVPKRKGGEESIDVTYTYDINSILEVIVKVVSTGEEKKIIIKNDKNDLSDEEIEARFKELEDLKIHPRDKEENRLILERGERLYEEAIGEDRKIIEAVLEKFEIVLNKQDEKDIREMRIEIEEYFNEIEFSFM
ncbi:MAG: Hsp70 family protein [Clostridium sp.]|uniref:Hsp70 family protein n=1 Tax=Clostridium sp. TaxID=1506 RepID=UPI003F37DCDA